MANTTNLNLVKPAGTDKALVSVLNSNSDKIDAWAGSTNQALSALTAKATISDCNTYNAEGIGRIVDSTANRPFNYGVLENLIYSLSGYRAQLAVSVSSQAYAYRTSNDGGSTWSQWKELALKSDVDRLFTNTSARYIKHFMFQNVASISIDLQHEQTNQYFSMIEVANANQNVFSLLEGSVKRTYGGTAVSMALSGSTATITRDDAGTLWGITHVTLTTNYQLT
jgi:hypothetical protein